MLNLRFKTPHRCAFCPQMFQTSKEGTDHTFRYHQLELQETPEGRAMIRQGLLFLVGVALILGGCGAIFYGWLAG